MKALEELAQELSVDSNRLVIPQHVLFFPDGQESWALREYDLSQFTDIDLALRQAYKESIFTCLTLIEVAMDFGVPEVSLFLTRPEIGNEIAMVYEAINDELLRILKRKNFEGPAFNNKFSVDLYSSVEFGKYEVPDFLDTELAKIYESMLEKYLSIFTDKRPMNRDNMTTIKVNLLLNYNGATSLSARKELEEKLLSGDISVIEFRRMVKKIKERELPNPVDLVLITDGNNFADLLEVMPEVSSRFSFREISGFAPDVSKNDIEDVFRRVVTYKTKYPKVILLTRNVEDYNWDD